MFTYSFELKDHFWRIILGAGLTRNAQQKLEQREAALKKFYKAEEDADEEGEREGTAKKIQGIKEMEAKEGLCELGQDQKVWLVREKMTF